MPMNNGFFDCITKLLQIQACLKEIHAKLLRKHLQSLERPLEDEDKLENAHVMVPEEEDTEDDIKGMYKLFVIMDI